MTKTAELPTLLDQVTPGRMYPMRPVLKSVFGWSRHVVYHLCCAGRIRSDATGKLVSGFEILRLAGVDVMLEVPESKADRRKRIDEAKAEAKRLTKEIR